MQLLPFLKNLITSFVIHFGKHNGKMLGTLPSNYLRNYEPWAKLADQVLEGPVYKGRIEWEFAENVLSGNNAKGIAAKDESWVSLLEMSERFGWDNEDKDGWSKGNNGGNDNGGIREERDCAGGSVRLERNQGSGKDQTVETFNRFPGREALLKKLLNNRRGFL
ncbi:hypothetical protein ES288_D10G096500v1 [Gossypium darwinii]|uniref:Uncharacterized protein n=1 Tax=Gossypium darwinii TaxID=34276 RepID=A0A5D2AZX9_GOSDA|nr:hypothetical protein ES288_D10G096500v1 [Gossypium darwinii]